MDKISLLPIKQPAAKHKKETGKNQRDRVGQLTHELANQLTVINLGCASLSHALIPTVTSAQLSEIRTIEGAVRKATDLLDTIRAAIEERSRGHQVDQLAPAALRSILQRNLYFISRRPR